MSISSSASPSPPETSFLPVPTPRALLDALPTYCGPSPVHVAPNNTIPRSFVHGRDDRTTSTAVLLVILLGMLNCLVWFSLRPVVFFFTERWVRYTSYW